jgi:microcompartment protein CcmK/EutM
MVFVARVKKGGQVIVENLDAEGEKCANLALAMERVGQVTEQQLTDAGCSADRAAEMEVR